MNSSITKLNWDSNFFGFDVGVIKSDHFRDQIELSDFRPSLIYLHSNESIPDVSNIIPAYHGMLMDTKVTFAKNKLSKTSVIPKINTSILFNEDIKKLAIETGRHSRFKTDPNISDDKFEELYTLWIKNSLNRSFSDEVLIYEEKNKAVGLITLKIIDNYASIGLIGVDESMKRKGIGKKLMLMSENWALSEELNEIRVVTQKENNSACEFYKALGYELVDSEYIYHFWNNNS